VARPTAARGRAGPHAALQLGAQRPGGTGASRRSRRAGTLVAPSGVRPGAVQRLAREEAGRAAARCCRRAGVHAACRRVGRFRSIT
jgi:hypothetical protein